MACGTDLSALPEDCIAKILSLTTPPDACRLSLISSIFRSAAESDAVWGRFLPYDYQSIIARSDGSSQSVIPLTKKQLYFRLCHTPLLMDEGKKSFSLDKWSGKKCYMIAARELTIVWGDTPHYWNWKSLSQSRFAEVAELRNVCWLEIRGKINTGMLSPETTYAAYLVCKFTNAHGFDNMPVDASVGIVGGESCTRTVCLNASEGQRLRHRILRHIRPFLSNPRGLALAPQPSMPSERNDPYAKERGDGWLEIELGEYLNEGEADEELEMSLMEVKRLNWKCGLIIQGIEIRPKESNNKNKE